MFCLQCGFELEDGYRFCPKCGFAVYGAEQASSQNELLHITKEMEKELRKQEQRAVWIQSFERIRNERRIRNSIMKAERKNKVVRCPRCKSISVSYAPRPSFGKAVIGYGVAGDAGAIVGSMMGKKRCAVCLNCGRTWKI